MKARLALKKEQAAMDEVGSNKALEGGEGDSQKFHNPVLAEGRVSLGHAEILAPPDTDAEGSQAEQKYEDEKKRKKSAKKKKRSKDDEATTDNEGDVSGISRSKSMKKKDKKSKSSGKVKKDVEDNFKKKVEE